MTIPTEHRSGECSDCEGTGKTCDEDCGDGACAAGYHVCETCGGDGLCLWAWEARETDGYCENCGVDGVAVDGWGEDGEDWVCLTCAQEAHKAGCGCLAGGWGR